MKYEALRKAEDQDCTTDYWREQNPRCPHCGQVYDIQEHEAWGLYGDDGSDHQVECGECDQEFTVTVHVSYLFSTDEQPDDDDE